MMERDCQIDEGGLMVRSARWAAQPGLIHGVTTRAALPRDGKSDLFDAVREARSVGAIPDRLTLGADQVHGDFVAMINEPIDAGNRPEGFRWNERLRVGEYPAADALVTTIPGLLLVIQTADCLPVFAVDRERGVAGLAHCGWRGLRAGLAATLIHRMAVLGARPGSIEAWLGPCIRPQRYEVSAELVEEFQRAFPAAPVAIDERHLDMAALADWQLRQAGVAAGQIADSGECTLGEADRYHSYRGRGPNAGRLLSVLGFDS